MSRKRDMYIDYEKSYRRRGRRRPKWYMILIAILILLGIGVAGYYSVIARIHWGEARFSGSNNAKNEVDNQDLASGQDLQSAQTAPIPTLRPTLIPSPTPGLTVTPTATPESTKTVDSRTPVKVKGVYVTSSVAGSDLLSPLIELTDSTEVNAMVINVKDDNGKISFKMDSPLANEIKATTNTIPDITNFIKELKEKNIYLIARIVAFKDPYLAEKRKDLAIKNQDGSIYRDSNGEGWVNPYNKKVWDYLIEIAGQAAAVGFDEVQFDYIRFSTSKGIDKANFGKTAKNKSKEEIIAEFTKYAYDKLKPLGVFVSADVYGTIINSKTDAGLVGQNYVEMAKYLDYICPMIYPSHFGEGNYGIQYPDLEPEQIIYKALTASKEKLSAIAEDEHKAIVRPWLQDFTATWVKHHMTYGGDELRAQINGVYNAGYEEWLVWNAGCVYSEDGLLVEGQSAD